MLRRLRLVVQMLRDIQGRLDMLKAQLLILPARQQPRNLEDVLDLPAIHIHVRQLAHLSSTNRMLLRARVEEVLPDRLPAVNGEFSVVEGDVDTGLEGWVECLHAVRGQEHCAFVVFEDAQEDGDELVALKLVEGALLEENIGFVKEQDGVPAAAHFENVLQLLLDFAWIEAEITGGHHIQWDLHLFGHALSSEGLADAGRTAKQYDHAAAFAFNHIVKRVTELALRLGKAEDELLLVLGQHKPVERVGLPLDVLDAVDEEIEPQLVLQAVAAEEGRTDELLLSGQRRMLGGIFLICKSAVNGHAAVVLVIGIVLREIVIFLISLVVEAIIITVATVCSARVVLLVERRNKDRVSRIEAIPAVGVDDDLSESVVNHENPQVGLIGFTTFRKCRSRYGMT